MTLDMCLAYFWGIESRKVALAKQMNVPGAVGGINKRMANLQGSNPWDLDVVKGVNPLTKISLTLKKLKGFFLILPRFVGSSAWELLYWFA